MKLVMSALGRVKEVELKGDMLVEEKFIGRLDKKKVKELHKRRLEYLEDIRECIEGLRSSDTSEGKINYIKRFKEKTGRNIQDTSSSDGESAVTVLSRIEVMEESFIEDIEGMIQGGYMLYQSQNFRHCYMSRFLEKGYKHTAWLYINPEVNMDIRIFNKDTEIFKILAEVISKSKVNSAYTNIDNLLKLCVNKSNNKEDYEEYYTRLEDATKVYFNDTGITEESNIVGMLRKIIYEVYTNALNFVAEIYEVEGMDYSQLNMPIMPSQDNVGATDKIPVCTSVICELQGNTFLINVCKKRLS